MAPSLRRVRKVYEMDWLAIMARITYDEAQRQNWPRPTCEYCYAPMAFIPRMYICKACYRDEFQTQFTLKKKVITDDAS
jgi:ribosomal protein S14